MEATLVNDAATQALMRPKKVTGVTLLDQQASSSQEFSPNFPVPMSSKASSSLPGGAVGTSTFAPGQIVTEPASQNMSGVAAAGGV